MTRDETVALFLECEAKREEARAAALAEGKSPVKAEKIAHHEAKAHWNDWAGALHAERKTMEADGRWLAEEDVEGCLQPQSAETQSWLKEAAADFSNVRFCQAPSAAAPVHGPGYTPSGDPGMVSETVDRDGGEAPRDDAPAKPEPPVKSIELGGNHANFGGFEFPGYADFGSAIFSVNADFRSTAFSGDAKFRSTTFHGHANFQSTAFSGDTDFENASFSVYADFRSAAFHGPIGFGSTAFHGDADFESAIFSAYADFRSATFWNQANLHRAAFSGRADFGSARFSGSANFQDGAFSDPADFEKAVFSGLADFQSARFLKDANFRSATFHGLANLQSTAFFADADFGNAIFFVYANFRSAAFHSPAYFGSARFSASADFQSAAFAGRAVFESATFEHDALFNGVTFESDVSFRGVPFEAKASFPLVHFRQYAAFEASRFAADASFTAIRGDRGFNMAGAVFKVVPDFIQAHFEEAPRLDNLEVGNELPVLNEIKYEEREELGRWGYWCRCRLENNQRCRRVLEAAIAKSSDLRNIPARWRALKRLAIQGHDTERELEFHTRELRSLRFTEDWPLLLAFWRGKAWVGFLRFWFGVLYGLFSDFGRSLIRPAAFWIAAVVLGAVFYVSQSPEMIKVLRDAKGTSAVSAAASGTWHAWLLDKRPCFAGDAPPAETEEDARKRESLPGKPAYTSPPYVGALSTSLQSGTDLANEAWHLAFRNAFIVLDGSSEAAHRTFGCLYGVELYGGSNPLAIVPSAVSTVSAGQKLFSALMIFLFGLALRNMLKMK